MSKPGYGMRLRVSTAALLAAFLLLQGCFLWKRKQAATDLPPAAITIAVLPPHIDEGGASLGKVAMSAAVFLVDRLRSEPYVTVAPLWEVFPVALQVLGDARAMTGELATLVAGRVGARWLVQGELSPSGEKLELLLDFVPVSSANYAFRYRKVFEEAEMADRLSEAARQFLQYVTRQDLVAGMSNSDDAMRRARSLAEALDLEYGWFRTSQPGFAAGSFATLAAADRGFAELLFNPSLYDTGMLAEAAAPPDQPLPADSSLNFIERVRPGVQAPVPAAAALGVAGMRVESQTRPAAAAAQIDWAPFTRSSPLLNRARPQRGTISPMPGKAAPPPPPPPQAAAQKPPEPSKPPAPPQTPRFQLQLHASREREGAERAAEKLRRAGFAAVVQPTDLGESGMVYRVRVGDYSSREDAAADGEAIVSRGLAAEYWVNSLAEDEETLDLQQADTSKPPIEKSVPPRAEGIFILQVRSFPSMHEALALTDLLRKEGLDPLVVFARIEGKGRWYRVRLRGYASHASADAEGRRLVQQGLIQDYWVIP